MTYSLTREDAVSDSRALRSVLASLQAVGCYTSSAVRLTDLADSIEEQVPKIDPVEALVREFTHEAGSDAAEFWTTVQWRKHHDAFAASLSEVLRAGEGDEYSPLLQQVRDLLFRSPSGSLSLDEIGTACKALRKGLSGILTDPQSDDAGALPTSPSPEVGVATSPPASSPATEDPQEFGSVVRAGYDEHTDRVLWVRAYGGWHAATRHGYHASFAGLHNPEVLRIGVGADGNGQAYQNGRIQGESHLRAVLLEQITALRDRAITGAEKYQLGLALDAVRAEL